MVLLVIDTQKQIMNEEFYNFNTLVSNVKKLINAARKNNIEIIYVRHDEGIGSELTKGTDGFEIYEEFKPQSGDKIFDKTVNSPFKSTGLSNYLNGKNEKNIIIVGLQTDYCVDASVKCGFEHGFHIIVPAYTNTTVNNSFLTGQESYCYYNEFIWKDRYAECISVEEVIKRMEN